MHRGSSNGTEAAPPAPETLPLSASPRRHVTVELALTRASVVTVERVELPEASPVRAALRAVGAFAEGCAVFRGETPIPLDTPLLRDERLTVVRTFSGG